MNLSRIPRKYVQWFSYVGLLIVFITFVVKDGMREQAREARDSVSHAKEMFQDRSTAFLIEDLAARIQAKLLGSNIPESDSMDILSDNAYVQKCTILIQDLAKATDSQDKATWRDDLHKVSNNTAEIERIVLPRFAASLKLPFEDRKKCILLNSNSRLLLAGISEKVSKAADASVQHKAEVYERWTWASYGFYTVGWILTILGKVAGIEFEAVSG